MSYIGATPVIGNFQKCDAITTSATDTFNLLVGGVAVSPATPQNCVVSLNGVIQAPTTAYTVSWSTIDFDSALTTSDVIDFIVILGNVLDLGTPSDDTVTNAKMADDAVGIAELSATGTASSSTFLRGDNSWQAAGGGAWNKLVRKTVTDGDAIIEFDDTTASEWFSSDYRVYKCILSAIEKNTLYGEFYMQTSTGGSYTTSGYDYVTQSCLSSQAGFQTGVYSESASFMQLTADNIGDAANESSYYEITFDNPLGTTNQKIVAWNGYLCDHNSRLRYELGVGSPDVTSAIDGFKFYHESGHTFKAGTATLYGLTT